MKRVQKSVSSGASILGDRNDNAIPPPALEMAKRIKLEKTHKEQFAKEADAMPRKIKGLHQM